MRVAAADARKVSIEGFARALFKQKPSEAPIEDVLPKGAKRA